MNIDIIKEFSKCVNKQSYYKDMKKRNAVHIQRHGDEGGFLLLATDGHVVMIGEFQEHEWLIMRELLTIEYGFVIPEEAETAFLFLDKKARKGLGVPAYVAQGRDREGELIIEPIDFNSVMPKSFENRESQKPTFTLSISKRLYEIYSNAHIGTNVLDLSGWNGKRQLAEIKTDTEDGPNVRLYVMPMWVEDPDQTEMNLEDEAQECNQCGEGMTYLGVDTLGENWLCRCGNQQIVAHVSGGD